MKKSELLKAAITTLWDGSEDRDGRGDGHEYVCFAIEAARDRFRTIARLDPSKGDPEEILKIGIELSHWVQTTLLGFDRCAGLEDWIEQHYPEKHYEYVYNTAKLQRLRKRWMQWMIRYWEAREAADAQCTLCAKVESPGFYTGCMIQDGACTDSGYSCDGNGNLKKKGE